MKKQTLSLEQIKALLIKMSASDKALFISLLLCGSKARRWTWEDALSDVVGLPLAVYSCLSTYAIEKKISIFPFNSHSFTFMTAHWLNGANMKRAIFKANSPHSSLSSKGRGEFRPLTTQEVTRRMKRYARLAGLDIEDMSLRTVVNTHHLLLNVYGSADEAGEALGLSTSFMNGRPSLGAGVRWTGIGTRPSKSRDPRLHGINRRKPFMKPA